MEIDEFIEKLKANGWRLLKGTIRRRKPDAHGDCLCPIEHIAGMALAYTCAGPSLGLSSIDVGQLVRAADGEQRGPIRTALLKACGLEECRRWK